MNITRVLVIVICLLICYVVRVALTIADEQLSVI